MQNNTDETYPPNNHAYDAWLFGGYAVKVVNAQSSDATAQYRRRTCSFSATALFSFQRRNCSGELDPMTEGMLKMMGVFAELERNMISQRVKSGMANAKAKGRAIGRPATTADNIPPSFYRHYPKYVSGEINKSELARLCGVSYPTVRKYLGIVERQA